MTASFKTFSYDVLSALWHSLPLPGADRGTSVHIICFHGVHTAAMEKIAPPPTSSISDRAFEAAVRGLSRYYRVVSLGDAVDMLRGETAWRERCAVLTFDDSLYCTAHVAFPILKKFGYPATIFVSTDQLETEGSYWWLRLDYAWHTAPLDRAVIAKSDGETVELRRRDIHSLRKLKSYLRAAPVSERERILCEIEEQLRVRLTNSIEQYPYARNMTWNDVRSVIASGFNVGSHTISHANLAAISEVEASRELQDSKNLIEKNTQIRCHHICYPYGAFTDRVAEIAGQVGYEAAVSTVGPGRNSKSQRLFALRRYSVPSMAAKLPYLMSGASIFFSRSK